MNGSSFFSIHNKNFLVNAICLITIAIGYTAIPTPYDKPVLNMGYFGFSGAITNWLAIHMLFEKVPGLYGSGIIPLKFESFKTAIRQMIMNQFFSAENIKKFFDGSQTGQNQLEPVIKNINYNMVFDAFVEMIMASKFGGMLGMFGGAKALEGMRETFCIKLREKLLDLSNNPDFIASLTPGDSESIHHHWSDKIGGIVDARLDELTPDMVKEIVQEMIRSHLGWLVVWGGVFGGLIGLISSFVI